MKIDSAANDLNPASNAGIGTVGGAVGEEVVEQILTVRLQYGVYYGLIHCAAHQEGDMTTWSDVCDDSPLARRGFWLEVCAL